MMAVPRLGYIRAGVLVDGASMAANYTSEREVMLDDGRVSLHILTGSATTTHQGTLYWDVSNDGSNWATAGSYAITSGSAINTMEDNIATAARYLRVRYVQSAGDGKLTVVANQRREG